MAEIASAYVSLMPSMKGFGSKLESEVGGEVRSSGSKLGGIFGGLFKVGAAAGIAAAAGGVVFLKGAVDEAREAQKVGAQTEQVIKSMGLAGQVSAKQIGDLATSLSNKTAIDDEAIQRNAALLIGFKEVSKSAGQAGGIFEQATAATLDYAKTFDVDLKSAAITVGKALNDPAKGLSALARNGVTFSQSQKDVIKNLVDTGQTAKAQAVILAELNREAGGQAAAQATETEKLAVSYGNLKEQIGTALLPIIDRLAKSVRTTVIPALSDLATKVGPAFTAIGQAVGPVVDQISAAFGGGTGSGIIAGITSIATAVGSNLLPVFRQYADTAQNVILPAVLQLGGYLIEKLGPVFTQVAGIITGQVLPILSSLGTFIYGTLVPAVAEIVTKVAKNLQPAFEALVAAIQSQILPAVTSLLAKFREYQPQIQQLIGLVVQFVGKFLEIASAILGKVLPPVIKFAAIMQGNVFKAIGVVIDVLGKVIGVLVAFDKKMIEGYQVVGDFAKKVGEKIGDVIGFFKELPGKVVKAVGNVAKTLYDKGVAIIEGFIKGITEKAKDIAGALKSAVTDKIPDWVAGPLQINSPSKIMIPIGAAVPEGLAKGIEGGGDMVQTALKNVTQRMIDSLKQKRDDLRSVLDGFRSDFASLKDSIANAFTGNLFEATTGAAFTQNLANQYGNLKALSAAFKKLLGFGLPPSFLSALFQSGNSALILDLAAGTKKDAQFASDAFSAVNGLAGQLGGAVAQADLGPKIDRTNKELAELRREVRALPKGFGREINGAVSHGARKGA